MKTRTCIKIAAAVVLLLIVEAQAIVSITYPQRTEPPWKSGETVVTLEDDGTTLRVSGKGAMEDYSCYYARPGAPWHGLYNRGDGYYKSTEITALVIEEGVTHIGAGAFMYCGITSLTIPNSVTSIGDMAFWETRLTSVTIPSSVTSIGERAFEGTRLTSVTIPNSVTSIGYKAFAECYNLISATFPGSIMEIEKDGPDNLKRGFGGSMFDGCTNLASVTIVGDGAKHIPGWMFSGCSSLTSITIPNGVTSIGRRSFYRSGLTSITIPGSVTEIDEKAFEYCTGLTSITIPSSVTSIWYDAFDGCTGLTSIILPNPKLLENCNFNFRYIKWPGDVSMYVPARNIAACRNTYARKWETPVCFKAIDYPERMIPLRIILLGFSIYSFASWIYLCLCAVLKRVRCGKSRKAKILLKIILSVLSLAICGIWMMNPSLFMPDTEISDMAVFFAGIFSAAAMLFYLLYEYRFKKAIKLPATTIILITCHVIIFAILIFGSTFKLEIKTIPEDGGTVYIDIVSANGVVTAGGPGVRPYDPRIVADNGTDKLYGVATADDARIVVDNGMINNNAVGADPRAARNAGQRDNVNNQTIKSNIVTEVRVTAKANDGYVFTGWSGVPLSDMSNPANAEATVVMNGNQTLTANFERFAPRTRDPAPAPGGE